MNDSICDNMVQLVLRPLKTSVLKINLILKWQKASSFKKRKLKAFSSIDKNILSSFIAFIWLSFKEKLFLSPKM